MPIYSYRCDQCGHQQDVLQKMSDPLLVTCPSCGQPAYRKQVTAAGFQLKGSGWYATDFRNPAKEAKGAATPEAGGAKDSTAPAESSAGSEASKPAAADGAKSEAAPSPKPAATGGAAGGSGGAGSGGTS